jgi:Mce-associated membrane protein
VNVETDDGLPAADTAFCEADEASAELEDDNGSATGAERAVTPMGKRRWKSLVVLGLLPGLALLLTVGASYLKWQDATVRDSQAAAAASVRAASDGTIAMLTYHPDSVEKDLDAARDRLTGAFRDSYSQLINEVVIPGAQQKRVSAVATVPAAASVSATQRHAVVLVFVNQTTTVGNDPPTATTSSVRVTLDKVDERWLVSQFDPI